MTKLSLVALLAISSAMAGGNIAPVVAPIIIAPVAKVKACNSDTTVNSKATAYYYTNSDQSLFNKDSSQTGTAITLDVKHSFTKNISANFSAVGFNNITAAGAKTPLNAGYFEGTNTGAFFNVANITANFANTTVILGRQLIDSPMFGGYDWLLAPGAFNGYTLVNNSISNLTLVGTYVDRWRANDSGVNFAKLAGSNYAFGAVYANKNLFDASVWYYNVEATGVNKYKQVYVDASKTLGMFNVAAQYALTNYNTGLDSKAYGVKVGASFAGIDIYAAYNNNSDRTAGYVGKNALYTTSWNDFAADDIGSSWKVDASAEFAGISTEISYADYKTHGKELDAIFGYSATKCISLDAIYSSTNYTETDTTQNALELIATYKF